MRQHFTLDPTITYLNHGAFGACPKPIFSDYQKWQGILEHNPVQFIIKHGPIALEESKKALGQYIHADPNCIVFTPNPTAALNMVIKGLNLQTGDEVLTTNHEYGALNYTWKYYCEKWGATYINQRISLPIQSKEKILEEFWKGLTPKTKIIFLSEITSPTGLIFPVYEICKKARELGIMTIIDGAHVPAHIPLNIQKMNPDIYTGACHKWMLAPKGCSFLYAKEDHKDTIDPLIISWGYLPEEELENRFVSYHQFNGTNDFSAYLTIPSALKFLEENHWESAKEKCREMIKEFYPIVAKELHSHLLCPLSDDFLGQLFSVPIKTKDPQALQTLFYEKHHIEIPIMNMGEHLCLRVSIQAYNTERDLDILIDAIRSIRSKNNLLL